MFDLKDGDRCTKLNSLEIPQITDRVCRASKADVQDRINVKIASMYTLLTVVDP